MMGTTLTDQESKNVQTVVDDWTQVLTQTAPIDRERVREAILQLYDAANLPRPASARSPEEQGIGPEVIYCTSVADYIQRALRIASILAPTDAEARTFTARHARSALFLPWADGNALAVDDYYAHYAPSSRKSPSEDNHPIKYVKNIAKCGFAIATFEKVAFMIERPVYIQPQVSGTPFSWHREDGPVLSWADGSAAWALHGFFVDEALVLRPQEQTLAQIHDEPNLELRRIRIERYGWVRYLQDSNAEIIDKRRNDLDGGTLEMLCAITSLDARVLVCTCATGRIFSLLVPVDTKTCASAQLYLSGNSTLTSVGRT